MHKKIMTSVVFGLLAFVLVVGGPVAAHEDEDHSSSNTTQWQPADSNSSHPDPAELKARLQKRKDTLNLRLSNAQKTRLQARCENAQGKIRSVEGRIKGIETSRDRVYANLLSHLTDLSGKLKTKNVDTNQLDAQISLLEESIGAFKAGLAEYKQAVADLTAMDCASDPEAFKAALEESRSYRKTLHETGQNIRKLILETIKPALAVIRAELAAQREANSSGEETD